MTTLENRPNTALLVIDVQNGVMAEAYDRDNVIANIATLIDKARAAGVDVVWIQHNSDELPTGSETWQYVPELVRRESEPLVQKAYGDSFEETDLEPVLAERGIGALLISGAQTDACIRSTLHGAIARGYDATLVGRRAHDRGPDAVRRSAARQGHRPHEPVLAVPAGSRPDRGHGQHRRRRLRGEIPHLSRGLVLNWAAARPSARPRRAGATPARHPAIVAIMDGWKVRGRRWRSTSMTGTPGCRRRRSRMRSSSGIWACPRTCSPPAC